MCKKCLLVMAFVAVAVLAVAQPANPEKDWKLGVQMWTFNTASFYTAVKKADSCKIHYVEAYPGQLLKDGGMAVFGPTMTAEERKELKEYLKKKEVHIAAFGVIVASSAKEWKAYFEFAADMGIPVITAEPEHAHLKDVNRLASAYDIKVAIHDHPRPSPYWHPDSVLTAIKGNSNLGFCADIGHWARNGMNAVDCIKKADGKILVLHFKDVAEIGNPQAPDVLPGEGVCNIPGVLAELKKQGFKGLLSIEYEEDPSHNMKAVKQHVKYYDEQLKLLK